MLIRQPIRNNTTLGEKKPRVFDALIDTADGEIYLELKNSSFRLATYTISWRGILSSLIVGSACDISHHETGNADKKCVIIAKAHIRCCTGK